MTFHSSFWRGLLIDLNNLLVWLIRMMVFVPLLYLKGLWFLFSSPFKFFEFVGEWERFRYAIEDNDEFHKSSEFFNLNRAERRKARRLR